MELFENIRREYEFGEGTIRGVARKLGVHRRMVREAIRNAMPMARKKPDRPHWKLKPFIPLIEGMLERGPAAHRESSGTRPIGSGSGSRKKFLAVRSARGRSASMSASADWRWA